MRDSTEYPRPIQTIHILKKQTKLPEQFGIFQILQTRIEFVYK